MSRIICPLLHDRLRIMTDIIACCHKRNASLALGIGQKLPGIIAHRGNRCFSGQYRLLHRLLRRIAPSFHPLYIRHDAPGQLRRNHDPEAVIRLKQNALRLHQSLSECAISCLSEIAALRMLRMGTSCYKSDLHIRDRRACQHASVLSFL